MTFCVFQVAGAGFGKRITAPLRGLVCAVLIISAAGCQTGFPVAALHGADEDVQIEEDVGTDGDAGETAQASDPVVTTAPPGDRLSLKLGTRLAQIARKLDQVTIAQSSAVREIAAAVAQQRARGFERYPQMRPTASAPLTGGETPSVGLAVEQLIWDGGRFRARMTEADMKVSEARLKAWEERNATVHEGLEAWVNISRHQARLAELAHLKRELHGIAALLKSRLQGGVADRGEPLKINVALQEVQRRIVTDTSAMRQARTDFLRLLPDWGSIEDASDLRAAAGQCNRSWHASEAPADALARVSLSQADALEDMVRAQRFPKVLLSGGPRYSRRDGTDFAVGIRLDATDMFGLVRGGEVDAAEASTQAAAATYALQRDDTRAELAQLEADYVGFQADAASLRKLVGQNDATLALYDEQLDAGSIPLTDGIVLHRERSDTRIALIDVQADILLNCLRSSAQRGLLAPFGADYGN